MLQQHDRRRSSQRSRGETDRDAGTPWWKRVTALFTLGSLVVTAGIVIAAAIGITALLMLFVLERAIAG